MAPCALGVFLHFKCCLPAGVRLASLGLKPAGQLCGQIGISSLVLLSPCTPQDTLATLIILSNPCFITEGRFNHASRTAYGEVQNGTGACPSTHRPLPPWNRDDPAVRTPQQSHYNT